MSCPSVGLPSRLAWLCHVALLATAGSAFAWQETSDKTYAESASAHESSCRGLDEVCLPSTAGGLRLTLPRPESAFGTKPNLLVPVAHSLTVFATTRVVEAWLWPEPFAETRLVVLGEHYAEAFSRPPKWDSGQPLFEWDGDRWLINVVGHGLLGSELHYRARRCGYGTWSSLLFGTVAASVWEYGFEAGGVRPSGLDLWFTPLSGLALGEFRFWLFREASTWDPPLRAWGRALVDPFGEIERAAGSPC